MKQVMVSQGAVTVQTVPAPTVEAGTVLVETLSSCVSVGTEMAGIRSTAMPLWKKALKKPENIHKVIEHIKTDGLSKTIDMINNKKTASFPTGYSLAGKVIAVGSGVDHVAVGDIVACAGAQCAHHAEIVRIPKNLCVKVPDQVPASEASTVALGAIALQGVRRASPTLGETFIVLGLGFLGQLTVQMLKSNGCKVIALDLDENRVQMALGFGADVGLNSADSDIPMKVKMLTQGFGADGVIITAASSSDQIMGLAFQMTRKKGRVVLVGDVGLNLNRGDFYEKEIDFFISSSYGPGRYDNTFEEKGLEYPLPFVRWTETRNMEEYLFLLSQKSLKISELVASNFNIDQAAEAYSVVKDPSKKIMTVILNYESAQGKQATLTQMIQPQSAKSSAAQLNVAVIGAGSFAKAIHLPHIKKHANLFSLRYIVTRTGHSAQQIAQQFSGENASTNYEDVLRDQNVHAVVIATRHNLHAEMALAALAAGKHVLLEKPMAMTAAEVQSFANFFKNKTKDAPMLLTGFNRRFSVHAKKIKEVLAKRNSPVLINYNMNAGYIPPTHWTQGAEGGGRNIGEACHIYDLFTYLVDSEVVKTQVISIKDKNSFYQRNDNFNVSFEFRDGSVANLMYSAVGNKGFPKETMDLHCEGTTIHLNDYKCLEIFSPNGASTVEKVDKGQETEIITFAEAILKNSEWPIPLWQQIQSAEMAMAVEAQL